MTPPRPDLGDRLSRIAARAGDTLRRHPAFVALVALHVLLKTVLAVGVRDAPLRGDEIAYADASLALHNLLADLVSLRSPDVTELSLNVIGSGWFMPGTSVVLLPLHLASPDAGPATVRMYVGLLTTLALVGAAAYVHRVLGARYALALLVVPGLVPMYVLLSFNASGDLLAGLVIVVLATRLVRMSQQLREGTGWRLRSALGLGALLALCLYLRSSALPVVGGSLVLVALAAAFLPTVLPRRRTLAVAGVAAATVVVGVLPWSVAASAALDARVVTTTTVPLSLAVAFGDVQELCNGPCDRSSNTWISAVRYSREVARATGASEVTVQAEMSERALEGVTVASYAGDVVDNTRRFVGRPTQFLGRLLPEVGGAASSLVAWTSRAGYALGVLALVAVALGTFRRDADRQVTALLVTLLAAGCLVQPFLHVSHGRYWPVFAPLMGLAIGVLLARPRPDAPPGPRAVAVLKVASAVALVATTIGVLVASQG